MVERLKEQAAELLNRNTPRPSENSKTRLFYSYPYPSEFANTRFSKGNKIVVGQSPPHSESERLRKVITKWEEHLFTFLSFGGVSPDNNVSERTIRNIKTKQKISGCFRTNDGADIYMMIKSIMETANKNGQSQYGALQALVNL